MERCARGSPVSNAVLALFALMFHLIPMRQGPANPLQLNHQPALRRENSAVVSFLSRAAMGLNAPMLRVFLLHQGLANPKLNASKREGAVVVLCLRVLLTRAALVMTVWVVTRQRMYQVFVNKLHAWKRVGAVVGLCRRGLSLPAVQAINVWVVTRLLIYQVFANSGNYWTHSPFLLQRIIHMKFFHAWWIQFFLISVVRYISCMYLREANAKNELFEEKKKINEFIFCKSLHYLESLMIIYGRDSEWMLGNKYASIIFPQAFSPV